MPNHADQRQAALRIAGRSQATRHWPPLLHALSGEPPAPRPRASAASPADDDRRRRRRSSRPIAPQPAGEARRPRHARRPPALRVGPARGRCSRSKIPPTRARRPTWSASCGTSTTRPSTQALEQVLGHRARLARGQEQSSPLQQLAGEAARSSRAQEATRIAGVRGPGHLRQDLPAVPHAVRRRRQGRPRARPARTAPNLDYLLSNILDPERRDGQGVCRHGRRADATAASSPASSRDERRPRATVQTANEAGRCPARPRSTQPKHSDKSMMPDDI